METQAKFPFLIEIVYGKEVFRYANADEEVYFEGDKYEPACFSIIPPTKSESGITDSKLSFSTIDQFWIEKIRTYKDYENQITGRFVATIIYEKDSIKYVEAIEDLDFTITNPNWTDYSMTLMMKFNDKEDIVVPMDICNSRTTPAVV